MTRDSFVFYRSFYESIQQLPKNEKIKIYDAIANFALNDVETELTGTARIIYEMAKPQISSNNRKYKNGLKGGRPRDDESPRKEIPDIDFVNITEAQYLRACERFNENVVNKAISILEAWLARGGKTQQQYLGYNHYGFFKADNWVIKQAQEAVKNNQNNWSV